MGLYFCYVAEILCIPHDEGILRDTWDKYFKLNLELVGDPEIYFGVKLRKMRLDNGVWSWNTSPSWYICELVKNVEKYLSKKIKGNQ